MPFSRLLLHSSFNPSFSSVRAVTIRSLVNLFKHLLLVFALFASPFSLFRGPAPVLINELFYHPATTNVLEEWVELYNPAATNVNLSGWRFSNGLQFSFPSNSVITAGGWLVIAADTNTFVSHNPGVTNFVPASAGPLSGHTLELDDNTGTTVNSVT